jgi:NADH:ubiquinone oxidoreductase subunit 6 (subunit J)
LNLTVIILLLIGLLGTALMTVMIRDLLKASVALAALSAVLTVILFLLKAPLAAVFELSVCAGLITVVFISTISMTKLRTKEQVKQHREERRRRFRLLPIIMIALLSAALALTLPHLGELIPTTVPHVTTAAEATVFWNERQADLLGQIVIVLAGVFGVLIFFKEGDKS